jgi:hypothetical protein
MSSSDKERLTALMKHLREMSDTCQSLARVEREHENIMLAHYLIQVSDRANACIQHIEIKLRAYQ